MDQKISEETSMSINARAILESLLEDGTIGRDSQGYREIQRLSFKPRINEKIFDKPGKFNVESAYELIGVDNQFYCLLKRSVEGNLTEWQVNEVVQHRFRTYYGPGSYESESVGLEISLEQYPIWCNDLRIKPDPNFPNW